MTVTASIVLNLSSQYRMIREALFGRHLWYALLPLVLLARTIPFLFSLHVSHYPLLFVSFHLYSLVLSSSLHFIPSLLPLIIPFSSFISLCSLSVSSDSSLFLKVSFPTNNTYDVRYEEIPGRKVLVPLCLSSPLPRVVGWETNERYELRLALVLNEINTFYFRHLYSQN